MGAIFFDLDGTLLDTVRDIRFYVNEMLAHFSYPTLSEEQIRAYVGDGAKKLIERALPERTRFDECFGMFSERFSRSDSSRTTLFEGEKETLDALKARGFLFAVITNKPQLAAERCLERFFPAGYFDFVGGDSGAFRCKPDPSLTRYAALSLRVPLRECVFVGDGETDVLTAKNAGMRGIAALWGYRTREQLARAGAREFAERFGDLEKIL